MALEISPIAANSRWFSTHWGVTGVFRHNFAYSFLSPQTITKQLTALNGLVSRAYFLLGIASQVKEDFSQQTVASSDPEVAKIIYHDYEAWQENPSASEIQLKIYQLANPQVNTGDSLQAEETSAINTGANAFTLTVGGTGYDLMVTINLGDTNDTALNKVAQVINNAQAGVTATLVHSDDQVHLSLQGPSGVGGAFFLADTAGNAVSASGANTIIQSAANAQFLVNGALHTQDSNTLSLLSGQLEVCLQGTGQATITLGQGAKLDMLTPLVSAMNNFSSYIEANEYLNPALKEEWTHLVEHYAVTLSTLGLEARPDGQFGLNTRLLQEAMENEPSAVIEAVSGERGLAADLTGFMAHILTAPGAALLTQVENDAVPYLATNSLSPWFQVAPSSFSQVV